MKKYIAMLMVVMTLVALFVVPVSASVTMSGDNYGNYSGTPSGYSYSVTGEYRTRYYNSTATRYVKSVVGHRTSATTTKVISVYGYDSTANTTKYSTIATQNYLTGASVSNLSLARTSAWTSNGTYSAYKAISATYSAAVTVYVTYESIVSGTTYIGYPNLYNIT